ncbi:efflux RND transporter periplasmic adaptor subunit [Pedobacter gandavensis]|uniref:efflux RND transporter periplasmic adaptor subunit n=1 Tax=Pedobacter TaxID=84567 RepID=UPI001C9A1E60|nr:MULTISPECIES: efflux RND transporter periplasmic adaptor subunit [Pedobacter]WGQ10318.1 efflux RND transporter periplasmic adaptor subunit [Pedobacter gandavensis]
MKSILLLSTAVFLFGCSAEPATEIAAPAPSLPVISISQSAETTYSEYPASLQGAVDLEIRPQVGGALEQIYVNEGALVHAGQPLFKINALPFLEQLNNAKANQRAAEAAVLNAQLEVDKLIPLVQNKVVSDFQLKTAKTAHQIALANVAQAKASVGTAQINMGYTLIKAPVSGYIGRLPKKQGSLVSPADPLPLTNLSDVHEIRVYFSLGEADFINFKAKYPSAAAAGNLKNLAPVSLILSDNSVYAQQGKIDMIDGQFDKNTGSITLRASFPNSAGLLRSGNTGKVRLSLEHNDAMLVPQSATVEVQDKVFVYTVDQHNKVAKQPIKVIGTSGTNYLIKDGLKSGDRIVSKGFEILKDGDAIVPEASTEKTPKIAAN